MCYVKYVDDYHNRHIALVRTKLELDFIKERFGEVEISPCEVVYERG